MATQYKHSLTNKAPTLLTPVNSQWLATNFTFTKKANNGSYSGLSAGRHNNAAQWQAAAACIKANGGTATGLQIAAAIQYATPTSASNAGPMLGYLGPASNNLGLIVAVAAPAPKPKKAKVAKPAPTTTPAPAQAPAPATPSTN
jgi:hypothetical protein